MTEVKFARMKRIEEVKIKTKKTRVIKNKTRKK
jgi:hypothetical protein